MSSPPIGGLDKSDYRWLQGPNQWPAALPELPGPLVGALQPPVVRLVQPADRRALRADVDLFAPVDRTAGPLPA
ncbi:hypothetical protein MAHJHV59_49960 [Mycobacterium avium subsp. hominissuis]